MKKILFAIVILFIFQATLVNAAINNYLILEDIGIYKLFTGIKGRAFSGPPSKYSQTNTGGVLASADHFSENDVSYEAAYKEPASKWPFVKVEVTQHTGVDSDKWLLHEIEDSYRDGDNDDNRLGLFSGAGVKIREINGNKVIYWGLGGGSYTWINGQKVIEVKYTDLQRTKPEPIEVVKAYLSKFPSTITIVPADFKASPHNVQWIKDEMERKLWLCDKWSMQLQLGKVSQTDMLNALVKHMTAFLYYRQKYYGVSADKDLAALNTYLTANDGTSIKKKLTEYKTWWSANKSKSISL